MNVSLLLVQASQLAMWRSGVHSTFQYSGAGVVQYSVHHGSHTSLSCTVIVLFYAPTRGDLTMPLHATIWIMIILQLFVLFIRLLAWFVCPTWKD